MTKILKLILKIFCVFLHILDNPAYSQPNLALKRPTYLSSTLWPFFASYAVDGDKTTYKQFAHTDGTDPGWLVVDLGKEYKVQYVILYNRKDCCGEREDYFSVGLSNNFNPLINLTIVKNILCGKYGSTTGNGETIRLNCSQPYTESRFVMLQQSEDRHSLNVQEFEVYGSEIYLNQYIGCCSQVQQPLSSKIVQSLEQCFQYCSTFNTIYITMINGSTCHCTNNIQFCSTSEECNITSINNDSMCGGQYYFSVYSVSDCSSGTQFGFCLSTPGSSSGCKSGWEGDNCNQRKCSANNGDCGNHTCVTNNFGVNIITECQCKNGYTKRHFNDYCTDIVFKTKYLGCFKDDQNVKDMLYQYNTFTMTNEECSKYCFDKKFQFMGTQYSGYCYCGNTYGRYGAAPESECNMGCSGNKPQICGGGSRNSVYSTCYIAALNKSCTEIFHCSNEIGTNGICTNRSCDPGWKGSFCDQRDCSKGYESRTIFDNCTDINECEDDNMCNSTTSTCINTNGSYLCECKRGFESVSLILCKDIDECINNPCNKPSQKKCKNTFGSYFCDCSSGYQYVNSSYCGVERNFAGKTLGIVFGTLLTLLVVVIVSIGI